MKRPLSQSQLMTSLGFTLGEPPSWGGNHWTHPSGVAINLRRGKVEYTLAQLVSCIIASAQAVQLKAIETGMGTVTQTARAGFERSLVMRLDE